jgi:monoamine oxidase
LYFSSPVTGVSWEKGRVSVRTEGGRVFEADRVVVSVSLGVLGSGGLGFDPVLPELPALVARLGYGSVVKILMEFRQLIWLKKKPKEQTLFILSDQPVPTWWTQSDDTSRVLTGWLAGERMRSFLRLDEAGRIESCLRSLATIFGLEPEWLRQELAGVAILDWAGASFVRGGYSFETVGATGARAALLQPVAETIYFCGEALYDGESPGTVEAALQSGWDVAERILAAAEKIIAR